MENAILKKIGYDAGNIASDGNRFLCANGYMGMRGIPEEDGSGQYAAVTLAGVYDRYRDRWREPVNAPHGLSVRLSFDGASMTPASAETVRHETALDYRYGLLSRDTDYGPLSLHSERFLSMADCHLMADCLRIRIRRDGMLEIRAGIPDDIWDINGPHLFDKQYQAGRILCCEAVTGEKRITVATAQHAVPAFAVEETYETGKSLLAEDILLEISSATALTVQQWIMTLFLQPLSMRNSMHSRSLGIDNCLPPLVGYHCHLAVAVLVKGLALGVTVQEYGQSCDLRMGLVADRDVEVCTLIDLERHLGCADDDHYVLVLGDLGDGIHYLLAVHGQMDYLSLEVLGGLFPGHAGLDGVVPSEPVHDAADVLLKHRVVRVDVYALGSQCPG